MPCSDLKLFVYEQPLQPPPCSNESHFVISSNERCTCTSRSLQQPQHQASTRSEAACSVFGPPLIGLDREIDPTGDAFHATHPMSLAHVSAHASSCRCRAPLPTYYRAAISPHSRAANVRAMRYTCSSQVVHHRALWHRCRVLDPYEANLFLVPLYTLRKVCSA